MSTAKQNDHYVAPYDEGVSFDELPDSAPSSRYSPSWTGWLGITVVSFWVFIAILGPYIAPLGENDLPFPDDYSEFQPPRAGAWLGTDVDDRDILSRLMYGAGRTIGISFVATVLAYFLGVVLGSAPPFPRPASIWSSAASMTPFSACPPSCSAWLSSPPSDPRFRY